MRVKITNRCHFKLLNPYQGQEANVIDTFYARIDGHRTNVLYLILDICPHVCVEMRDIDIIKS